MQQIPRDPTQAGLLKELLPGNKTLHDYVTNDVRKKGAAFDVVEMPENTKVPTTSLNKMIRSASHCHNTSVMNIVLSNMQHKEAREGQMG